jgi:branched-chain amino acid transport system substrate-binding protein
MSKSTIEKTGEKGLTRRGFLKASAGGAAGLVTVSYVGNRLVYAQNPINLACISLFSGRPAVVGTSVRDAIEMWKDEVNEKGGISGRKVEIKYLDSRVKIEEAVRLARELAASGDVDGLLEGCSSREAFAVKEVSRDLNFLTLALCSKTTELTANPNTFAPYHFRVAAQNCHDMAAGAKYAVDLAKKNGWTRWAMIAPDYAYGRENVMFFVRFLKKYFPEAEVLMELWPKVYEPDFTPYITKILGAKVQAVFTSQWGGDIVALLEQGALYGFTERIKLFSIDLGDFTAINPVIKAFGKFPEGLYMGTRANPATPATDLNKKWFYKFKERAGYEPSGWSQQAYSACLFYEKAVEKAGTTDQKAVSKALEDLEIVAPWGTPPSQKLVLRGRDHANTYYTAAWGATTSTMPYVTGVVTSSWEEILKAEDEWLKEKGWL